MSVWREAVRAELSRFRARTGRDTVTRGELLRQSLDDLEARFPGSETPEQSLSRTLQELRDRDEIEFRGDGEYAITELAAPFERGTTYTRSRLHDAYGGMRQSGIAPSADYPFVFLFYGAAGEQYGYDDGFRGDTFVYTGEGQVGDMEMTHGNRVVRDHAEDGRRLYLFENADGGEVTFVGEYEYGDHFRQEMDDANGDRREAVRFELVPAGASGFPTTRRSSTTRT
ncbi:hypothetical protein [Halosegnis marinus]|uniref:hypothetical protein n=1 Tax=Halosegnis marinus TaxID=3034023 RepID=UPI0036238E49